MTAILDMLVAFFKQENWNFTPSQDDESALNLVVSGKNGKWRCFAKAREDHNQVLFYSICGAAAPDDKRVEVAEFLTRANYDLVIGNFEMNYTDGEIRYRTSIDVEGDRLNMSLIKNMIYANVIMMDRYLPGIKAVIYGEIRPEKALQMVEG